MLSPADRARERIAQSGQQVEQRRVDNADAPSGHPRHAPRHALEAVQVLRRSFVQARPRRLQCGLLLLCAVQSVGDRMAHVVCLGDEICDRRLQPMRPRLLDIALRRRAQPWQAIGGLRDQQPACLQKRRRGRRASRVGQQGHHRCLTPAARASMRSSCTGSIASTRDAELRTEVRKRAFANPSSSSGAQVQAIRAALRGELMQPVTHCFQVTASIAQDHPRSCAAAGEIGAAPSNGGSTPAASLRAAASAT